MRKTLLQVITAYHHPTRSIPLLHGVTNLPFLIFQMPYVHLYSVSVPMCVLLPCLKESFIPLISEGTCLNKF